MVRPIPPPFDDIVAGRPATIRASGTTLLNLRLLTKDLAFSHEERAAFGLRGLLPDRVTTIEEQLELEHEHIRRKPDDLEKYIGLAALQDRNATLYYRLLAEHMGEYLPIVYTPTVGRACQEFSHIIRRTRGIWITPPDVERIPELLAAAPFEDVRLIVVTDNERILGLGDLGAGGMAIPIGKLALYTAACGIHPTLTLPVSLDVGTDNPALLRDPLYLGHRAPRLRGSPYDALVEAFVVAVQDRWPGCLIQWEDFKQHNALRILERYRDRVPSFNDDVQGTAGVIVAGLLASMRHLGTSWADQRIVLAGAGAAGLGIAALIRLAMVDDGLSEEAAAAALVLVDSRGLIHAGRPDLDPSKQAVAVPIDALPRLGLWGAGGRATRRADDVPNLEAVVAAVRPTALIGTTGVPGTFTEAVIRAMAAGTDRPLVMPLSNPTAIAEATPEDVLRWTEGRAIVASGSPFEAVTYRSIRHEIGQANNVYIFPGVGLGAIVSESRCVSERMFLTAARTLADLVTVDRFTSGAIYPPIARLRESSRAIAIAVAEEAVRSGLAGAALDGGAATAVDAAMWWPGYVPYVRG